MLVCASPSVSIDGLVKIWPKIDQSGAELVFCLKFFFAWKTAADDGKAWKSDRRV